MQSSGAGSALVSIFLDLHEVSLEVTLYTPQPAAPQSQKEFLNCLNLLFSHSLGIRILYY